MRRRGGERGRERRGGGGRARDRARTRTKESSRCTGGKSNKGETIYSTRHLNDYGFVLMVVRIQTIK